MHVVITSAVAQCSAGNDLNEIYNATTQSQSRLSPANLYGIDSFFGQIESLPSLPDDWPEAHRSRNNQLMWSLFKQLEASYLRETTSVAAERIGLVVGTSTSGISEVENQLRAASNENKLDLSPQSVFSACESFTDYLGIKGPTLTISTACSSGANALGTAKRWLEASLCDVVLVLSADTLCALTVRGFSALGAMSSERCLPYSSNRQGINLGEGGAAFVLKVADSGIALTGFGAASDAHHFSAPDPDAQGAMKAMTAALKNAKKDGADIQYLNLHGTATEQNDAMEAKAVTALMPEVAVSSTKGFFGHTLGAAGAIEAALCFQLLLEQGKLPVHLNDNNFEPSFAALNFVQEGDQLASIRCVMSTSFAFGGSNSALILERLNG